jgi:hypothetical protein
MEQVFSSSRDRPAEIEVTPSMMEEGEHALFRSGVLDDEGAIEAAVKGIYLAMAALAHLMRGHTRDSLAGVVQGSDMVY